MDMTYVLAMLVAPPLDFPPSMFARFFILLGASCTAGFGSVTLQQADSFWKFDGAASGAASNAQIVDFTGNHTASNATRLSWNTSVPATSPAGGAPQDTLGRALSFDPFVTVVGAGTADDTTAAATFQVANGTVSGNFSVLTRAMWDGPVLGADGVTPNDVPGNYWLMNNGLGGNGIGFLFGLLGNADGQTARLAYYTSAGGSFTGTRTSTSTLAITKGVWYDIGMVVDMGDGNAATPADNSVTFYLHGPGGLQTQTVTGMYISDATTTAPSSTLTVGSESGGVGTSNQRKSFDGSLDYLAMFDESLTQAEVQAIFAAPEPGRALLLGLGLAGMLLRRRRA
ncbi:hypothetical protein GCM10023213_12510 [Prosthecobacter algae]|uniref:PEP-CTERM protein-sorting domain-containing protein n=2 Tax=Prosthecobacter algae TaxID=1144682 RepID=A0ABP9P0Y3_9BACT